MSGLIINPFAHGGSGGVPYWDNVRGQFHFNGENLATSIIDTGPLANTLGAAGTASLSTVTTIFGSTVFSPSSGGSADGANTNFRIGDNPFTIRFWVRKIGGTWASGEKVVCGVWGGAELSWLVTINAVGQVTFYYNGKFPFCPQALPDDTAAHMVSISRLADYSMHCHIDGIRYGFSGTTPGAGAIPTPTTQPFRIGNSGTAGQYQGASWSNRFLDELEIIIGQSLYTSANYSPDGPFPTPTPPDPDFASVGYLLHGDGANNGVVFANGGPTAVVPTRSGAGIVTSATQSLFGGASIRCPAASGNKLQFPSSDAYWGNGSSWEFEASLYRDVAGTTQVLLDGNNNGSNSTGPILYINASDKLTLWSGPQGADYGGGGTTIPINTWTRIAVSWDGTTLRFYVNGTLDQSATGFTNGWSTTAGPCLFADKNASILQGYRGWADEIRFTRVARHTGASYDLSTDAFPNH